MDYSIVGIFGDVAKFSVNEPETGLQIKRSVSEFTVEIPIKLTFLDIPDRANLRPCLEHLWGDVSTFFEPNNQILVGKVLQLDFREEYRPAPGIERKIKWSGNLAELAHFERLRDGGRPKIHLQLRGGVHYLTGNDVGPHLGMRTRSTEFFVDIFAEFSKDIWIERLRSINFLENILIEIPLPTSPPSPWDEVWSAMVEARDAFEKGGTTGWKNCIVSIRLALEKWREIEGEQLGEGGHGASRDQKLGRTKEERLDHIRWHLLWYAHYSAHTHADKWTREDAILMLSTVTALLAKRNP